MVIYTVTYDLPILSLLFGFGYFYLLLAITCYPLYYIEWRFRGDLLFWLMDKRDGADLLG